jgi:hypothetical protein
MTLIALVATSDYIVQVADRKLTGGGPGLREQNKTLVVNLPNDVKLLVGYAGLAHWGKAMNKELVHVFAKLFERVGMNVEAFYEGLAEALDNRFKEFDIARLPRAAKPFSLVVASIGQGTNRSPLVKCATVSNYKRFGDTEDERKASNAFQTVFYNLEPAEDGPRCAVITIGDDSEFQPNVDQYKELLSDGKGATYMRDRLVADVTRFNPTSRTVGDDMHSVIIEADFRVQHEYHVSKETDRWPFIDQMLVSEDLSVLAVAAGELTIGSVAGQPEGTIRRPEQSKKSRCWCGSGKRYSQCHGIKSRSV